MRTTMTIMAAMLVAGCGSTSTRMARLERTIEEQREVIAQLQAERLTGVRADSTAGSDEDTDGRTEVATHPGPMPMPVTPQHWANPHGPPPVRGHCSAVRTLHIVNRSDHYIAVMLDGEPVNTGPGLPYLTPNGRIELCLSRIGRHTIGGELYDISEGVPRSLGVRFLDSDIVFDESTYPYAYQRYLIDGRRIDRSRLR